MLSISSDVKPRSYFKTFDRDGNQNVLNLLKIKIGLFFEVSIWLTIRQIIILALNKLTFESELTSWFVKFFSPLGPLI